jgi:hypothetical protein
MFIILLFKGKNTIALKSCDRSRKTVYFLYICFFILQFTAVPLVFAQNIKKIGETFSNKRVLVTLKANDALALNGVPTKSIRVLIKTRGSRKLYAVPSQVDEIVKIGRFELIALTPQEGNNIFDSKDEVIFELSPEELIHSEAPSILELKTIGAYKTGLYTLEILPGRRTKVVVVSMRSLMRPKADKILEDIRQESVWKTAFTKENPTLVKEIKMKVPFSEKFISVLSGSTLTARLNFKYFLDLNVKENDLSSRVVASKEGPLRTVYRIENELRISRLGVRAMSQTDYVFTKTAFCGRIFFMSSSNGKDLFSANSFLNLKLAIPDSLIKLTQDSRRQKTPFEHTLIMLRLLPDLRSFVHRRSGAPIPVQLGTDRESSQAKDEKILRISYPLREIKQGPEVISACVQQNQNPGELPEINFPGLASPPDSVIEFVLR